MWQTKSNETNLYWFENGIIEDRALFVAIQEGFWTCMKISDREGTFSLDKLENYYASFTTPLP